jgi:hypothetical protein
MLHCRRLRLGGAAALARRPPVARPTTSPFRRRKQVENPTPPAVAHETAPDQSLGEALGKDDPDPDPRVVRCFEQHALETARRSGDDDVGDDGDDDGGAEAWRRHTTPSSPSTSSSSVTRRDAAAAALVQAEIEAREAELVHRLLASTDKLPPAVPTTSVLDIALAAVALSRSAGLGSAFRALQALKRAPGLLAVPERELARRALALKVALPAADVGALVSMRPALLLLARDAPGLRRAVSAAAKQVTALMPGIPWQRKLAEGGGAYWSFMSVLDEGIGGVRAAEAAEAEAAAEARAEQQQQQQQGQQPLQQPRPP